LGIDLGFKFTVRHVRNIVFRQFIWFSCVFSLQISLVSYTPDCALIYSAQIQTHVPSPTPGFVPSAWSRGLVSTDSLNWVVIFNGTLTSYQYQAVAPRAAYCPSGPIPYSHDLLVLILQHLLNDRFRWKFQRNRINFGYVADTAVGDTDLLSERRLCTKCR
jgi:hypothetical protein